MDGDEERGPDEPESGIPIWRELLGIDIIGLR
jgi:hypothetical protein